MTLLLLMMLATSPTPEGAKGPPPRPTRAELDAFIDAGMQPRVTRFNPSRGGTVVRKGRDFSETLLKLREAIAKPPAQLTPAQVSLLERLAVHWYPGFSAPAQAAQRKRGVKDEWPKVTCPTVHDLTGWTQVPSISGKGGGSCTATPSREHLIVHALDDGTCIQSTNNGEWGSTLEVLGPGRRSSMKGGLFHPAELVVAPHGFWIIESLEHLSGSGGLTFLSLGERGGVTFTQLESLPGSVAAYKVVGDRLHLAVRESGIPENPCKLDGKSTWILSFGETGGGVLEPESSK